MMNFRVINKRLIALMGDSAAGRYTVTGYRRQGKDATESRGSKRNIQTFFQKGNFPKDSGRFLGATDHHMNFVMVLTVSAPCQANLAAINNPQATAEQITTALAGMRDASFLADESMDELYDIAYQILMDARNFDLGLGRGVIADRWVAELEKDDPLQQGALVTLTGRLTYTCRTTEEITGDVPVLADSVLDLGLDFSEGDDLVKAGILTASRIELGVVTFNGDAVTYEGEEVTFSGY